MNHTASLIRTGSLLLLAGIAFNYPFREVKFLWKEMKSPDGRYFLKTWMAKNWREAARRIASAFCFYSGVFLLLLTLA